MSMGEDSDDLRLMIDGEWMLLTKEFIHMHPGGSVINHYRYLCFAPLCTIFLIVLSQRSAVYKIAEDQMEVLLRRQ